MTNVFFYFFCRLNVILNVIKKYNGKMYVLKLFQLNR